MAIVVMETSAAMGAGFRAASAAVCADVTVFCEDVCLVRGISGRVLQGRSVKLQFTRLKRHNK